MKNQSILVLSIFAIIILQSCRVDLGLQSQYKRLSENDKEKIIFLEPNAEICELKKDGKIYGITGKQLLECIETQENVMVYFWKWSCTSDLCYPLIHVQKYCDERGLILYAVVADSYRSRMFLELESLSKPLFAINEFHYQEKKPTKFIKLFMEDLLKDPELSKEIWWHGSYVFNHGKLVDSNIIMEVGNAGELKTIEFKFGE